MRIVCTLQSSHTLSKIKGEWTTVLESEHIISHIIDIM